MAAENDRTRVERTILRDLPKKLGRKSGCIAGLIEIEDNLDGPDEKLAIARAELGETASEYAVRVKARPALKEAWMSLGADDWSWVGDVPGPGTGPQFPFVVLRGNPVAGGTGGGSSRTLQPPEILELTTVEGAKVVFLDRRKPDKVDASGLVKMEACGTRTFRREGPDGIPTGRCGTGPFNPGLSDVYASEMMRPAASPGYWSQYYMETAKTLPTSIVESKVTCLGGSVGRLLGDSNRPSCNVRYKKAIFQRRTLKTTDGMAAWDSVHADRIVDAFLARELMGETLSDKLVEGEYAIGMPWTVFAYSQPTIRGCQGRALLERVSILGKLRFSCKLGDKVYDFEDMVLVKVSDAQ